MATPDESRKPAFQVIRATTGSLFHAGNPAGELVPAVFDFEHLTIRKGESVVFHWSPNEIVLVCIHGEGCFRADGLETELSAGTTILVEPGVEHSFFAWEDCYLILMYRDLTQVN